MNSRAARLALLFLFLVAIGVSGYLFWASESLARTESAAARAFDDQSAAASRNIVELRAAQQAYVAAGQTGDFWSAKVTALLGSVQQAVDALRRGAVSPQVNSELDAVTAALQDFGQMDGRARDYVRKGQNLLASDLIFANGLEQTEAALGALDRARVAERSARDEAVRTFERRRMFALFAAAAASCLVVLLLLPRVENDPVLASLLHRDVPRRAEDRVRHDAGLPVRAEGETWTTARRAPVPGSPAAPPVPTPQAAAENHVQDVPPAAAAEPPRLSTDFATVAMLCTELARVVETTELAPLLDRAAHVLDASGVILWVADHDGRELNPAIVQGYPPHIVSRLGPILRDANNATAAAYRSAVLQTVSADEGSNGAIVAPLVTCVGCVGVMAAEVRNKAEQQTEKLAAAAIVAAQLATLVGPPASREPREVEIAGA